MEQQQIDEHITHGAWRGLETLALQIVDSAERGSGLRMAPVLGGGTRLMLALRHRLSDDIDVFIRDPQWIGYLTPDSTMKWATRCFALKSPATS